jgi:hypothetical protein
MSGMMLAFAGGSYGAAPVNTVAPVVSGTATVGQTLSTTNGTWTGAPAPTFTYQWQRVTTNISGATSSTYVLVDADGGSTIRCVVKATNAVAPSGVTANSNSTAAVAAIVPGAPTIGTATATGSSTATVAYTAPASNGGATITLYTATSSPGGFTGTLATAGSGTITVTGLAATTSYTFTVKATNSVGQSAASGASNSITTTAVTGQQVYSYPYSSNWLCPAGVTSVSVMVVGGGGGGGGALCYTNNISVTPGNTYTATCTLSAAIFLDYATGVTANGAYAISGAVKNANTTGFGGGAAGYAGKGGDGNTSGAGSAAPAGGGGGGAGGVYNSSTNSKLGGGGGVGLLGQGASGAGGAASGAQGGGGGSGGNTGGAGGPPGNPASGGNYGSAGGLTYPDQPTAGNGGLTAIRIMWPGTTRSYPSTNTGNL